MNDKIVPVRRDISPKFAVDLFIHQARHSEGGYQYCILYFFRLFVKNVGLFVFDVQ